MVCTILRPLSSCTVQPLGAANPSFPPNSYDLRTTDRLRPLSAMVVDTQYIPVYSAEPNEACSTRPPLSRLQPDLLLVTLQYQQESWHMVIYRLRSGTYAAISACCPTKARLKISCCPAHSLPAGHLPPKFTCLAAPSAGATIARTRLSRSSPSSLTATATGVATDKPTHLPQHPAVCTE